MNNRQQYIRDLINGEAHDDEDQKLLKAGRAKADDMTNYLNIMGDSDRIAAFIYGMRCQHRTLQQAFTRLCLAWFEHLANAPDHEFDGRNEASRDLAKHIVEAVPPEHRYLPLI